MHLKPTALLMCCVSRLCIAGSGERCIPVNALAEPGPGTVCLAQGGSGSLAPESEARRLSEQR